MLDTTVYIDAQRGKLPDDLAARIGSAHIRHSAVALGEIAANIGLLHPAHPGTAMVNGIVRNILTNADTIRTTAPSSEAWLEASVLAGILARTQGFDKADRRKLLNDALIFLSAAEEDAILISRNVKDMDLLLQLRPDVQVVLYTQRA
jgi:predicted nucleic acid-binding protein